MGTFLKMISFVKVLLVFGYIYSAKGECPAPDDIPIMYDENTFTCATFWAGPGADQWVDACNGGCDTQPDSFTVGDGTDYSVTVSMGSVFVKPGCQLFMYPEANYKGKVNPDTIHGGAGVQFYNNEFGGENIASCGRIIGSYKCRCQQTPVTCIPTDGYEVVMWCDNTAGNASVSCSYEKSIGTSYSQSMSHSMSIDTSISTEMSVDFFRRFSATIGVSLSTGYNWESVSERTMSETETFIVSAHAPPGMVLVIEQAVGRCDDSTVNTEMFRTSHQQKDGKIVYSQVERHQSPTAKKIQKERKFAKDYKHKSHKIFLKNY